MAIIKNKTSLRGRYDRSNLPVPTRGLPAFAGQAGIAAPSLKLQRKRYALKNVKLKTPYSQKNVIPGLTGNLFR